MKRAEPNDQTLRATLRESGLRATSARVAVLRCLLDAEGPLSHGEVCELLNDAGFDRATLYRNLTDLTDVGIARRGDLGDHLWRFELRRDEADHDDAAHAHFICTACGDVACLPDEAIDLKPVRGGPRALARRDVEIQVRGTCNDCT